MGETVVRFLAVRLKYRLYAAALIKTTIETTAIHNRRRTDNWQFVTLGVAGQTLLPRRRPVQTAAFRCVGSTVGLALFALNPALAMAGILQGGVSREM